MKIQTLPKVLRILTLVFIAFLFMKIISAEQAQNVQKEIKKQNLRITKLLRPSAKQKIARASKEYETRIISSNWQVDYYRTAAEVIKRQFGNLPSQDIDVLVQQVMFEIWKSEEEALKEMLDEMHRMNQVKKKQREYIKTLKQQRARSKTKMRQESKRLIKQPPTTESQRKARLVKKSPKMAVTRHLRIRYPKTPTINYKNTANMSPAELEKYTEDMEKDLDSLGGLSEELSLKMQILTERRAKIIQTLSSILKKISQTSDAIISNIK